MKRIVVLLAVALSACSLNTTEVASVPSDPATETFASSLNVNISQMTKTANGTYYKDIVIGDGATLAGLPTVMISYGGFLKNGTVFDQGTIGAPGYPLSGLVFGMQEGMQGMRVHGERLIVIPSALGYGNTQGLPVPPNSTIIFDVRLDQLP
jgi:FKBP-type peptidyl-prolyl cis-trans isomerase FkpA